MKTEQPEITEEIKNFLNTKEGKHIFAEITPNETHASRSEFKKSFIDPPKNVRKHLLVRALLQMKLNEIKLKKKLDNNELI